MPRDIASRAAKQACDDGYGVGPTGFSVYLDFAKAIERDGEDVIRDKYGNLFSMYEEITGEDPYKQPMRIYPAPHYTMGGLWVDYNLMSTVPGLYVIGEANFSDHGANRLGASALMQGLCDGYFVLPYTIGDYLAQHRPDGLTTEHEAFGQTAAEVKAETDQLLAINGTKTVKEFHWELGRIMWDYVGMSRTDEGLKKAIKEIRALRKEFHSNVKVSGNSEDFNKDLEMAGRVKDYLEFGELMAMDALNREESCGGHFRAEFETEDGEALRNDEDFCYVAAWEFKGDDKKPKLHKEELAYENVELKTRSYK